MHGAKGFSFEILETLDSEEEMSRYEMRKALKQLEEKWMNPKKCK